MRSEFLCVKWLYRTVSLGYVLLVLYFLIEARAVMRVHLKRNSWFLVVFALHEVL
jgi:hypothetical protein